MGYAFACRREFLTGAFSKENMCVIPVTFHRELLFACKERQCLNEIVDTQPGIGSDCLQVSKLNFGLPLKLVSYEREYNAGCILTCNLY